MVDSRTRRGIWGVRVEAWDKDLLIDDLVGSAVTDGEGRFQIRFGGGFFRELCVDRRPDLFFKVFRGDELVVSTENAVLWNAKAGEIPVAIAVQLPDGDGAHCDEPEAGGNGGPPAESPSSIHGRVTGPGEVGIPALRVEAVDVGMGGEVALGGTETGVDGGYRIVYDTATVTRRGKAHPDVRVRVRAAGELLATSPVVYNAAHDQVVDVAIAAEKVRQPPEYERLGAAIGTLLGANGELGPRLAAVREDDERQELTWLANKSGWDARMVAMASLAARFAAEWGVGAEYFYALFRAGVPASEAALSRLAPDAVRALWERGANEGVIPRSDADGIDAALERFRERAVGGLLTAPPAPGGSTLGELLGTSLRGDEAASRRFAELYQAHGDEPDTLWTRVEAELGKPAAERLQLDGKLSFLTLNNAPLLERIHYEHAPATPADLVRAGLHRADAWLPLLEGVEIPDAVPGGSGDEKRASYAALMAGQLRLGYPTAVVAEQVRTGELPLRADPTVAAEVHRFLADPATGFELGMHPVEAYVRENGIELSNEVLGQVKRLQRVYQITPSDGAMQGLLEHGLDSARAVVQLDEQAFVQRYGGALGGEAEAAETHRKAAQVHHAVLSLATAYLLRGGAPPVHAITPAQTGGGVLGSAAGTASAPASAVLPYPTLEGLFGEMDYCACDHCRSVLGPAAYLVDLLRFVDRPQPPPAAAVAPTPLQVLLARRPDIEELPLTCENTNTALPYIDLVNELLEFLVVHGSLQTPPFAGYDTASVPSADLLANPQNTDDAAYVILRDAVFPIVLPFHQPLEALRLYFGHFDVPLHRVLERLRVDDALDRTGLVTDPDYAWRDILMERLGLSRQAHRLLTDHTILLADLYGTAPAVTSDVGVVLAVSGAGAISRVLGVSYEELVELVRTEWVNPDSWLIPRLERLGLDLGQIGQVKAGTLTSADLKPLLPLGLDPAAYGGDVKQWIVDHHDRIMQLVVLSDPTGANEPCSFATLELRHAKPYFATNRLLPIELRRLQRFVRLWRALGWSLRDTDRAVHALWPASALPDPKDGDKAALLRLDTGFKLLLPRLGHLCRAMDALELNPAKDLLPLLACWAPIDTLHPDSLYRRMFLGAGILRLDAVFQDDGYGTFLSGPPQDVDPHREALRAAFGMTGNEVELVLARLGNTKQTPLPLTLATASAVFHHGWLARKLRLSMRELLGLIDLSGLDPFSGLDPAVLGPTLQWPRGTAEPPILPFIEFAGLVRGSGVKISTLLYWLRHEDPGGKAQPPRQAVLEFALRLRGGLAGVNRDLGAGGGPTAQSAQAQMALVYGDEAAATFFGLLTDTVTYSVHYSHVGGALGAKLAAVSDGLDYDGFQKRLSFRGTMTVAAKAAIKTAAQAEPDIVAAAKAEAVAANAAGLTAPTPATALAAFDKALSALFAQSRAFFDHYPDLEPLLTTFQPTKQTLEQWLPTLLADFLPALREKLKRQQVRQTVAAELSADAAVAAALLEDRTILHADGDASSAALYDFLALETGGLTARYYFSGTISGTPDLVRTDASIQFGKGGDTLPANPASPAAARSVVWNGWLEAPDDAFYNFRVDTDAGAGAVLSIDGTPVALQALPGGDAFENTDAVELKAGRLYPLELAVSSVTQQVVLQWEGGAKAQAGAGGKAKPTGLSREVIPPARLCPAVELDRFAATYLRLGKAMALAGELHLSAAEVEFAVKEFGVPQWFDLLPVQPATAASVTHDLAGAVAALLRYAAMKAEYGARDDALARALGDAPVDGGAALAKVAGWAQADLRTVLSRFAAVGLSDLRQPGNLVRVHRALTLARALGVGAAALADASTNQPAAGHVVALQSVLRARYDEAAWRTVLQPVNDRLRALQRDALVAAVLAGLRASHPEVNTPDKLYEHLLIDVEMEPCMATSRVRQAIATVQLFIQRCLLNLEREVSSAAIHSAQWEWMKRYRVWEANRKVFLYPENWLEPELRDDKSPLFKDLETELLQGDITDDAAASALASYLTRLEEVAMLEVCGMYLAENDPGGADDVLHVVARTAGAKRLYFHRRLESGAWTPWEKIGVAIEDNPVLPVVWRGRLFLFWVGIQQKMPDKVELPLTNQTDTLTSLTGASLKTDTKVAVAATLHWSECVRGKWQPTKTSDVARPTSLGRTVEVAATTNVPLHSKYEVEFSSSGPGAFDRARLRLSSREDASGLTIDLTYDDYPNGRDRTGKFHLYNTSSLPVRGEDMPAGGSHLFMLQQPRYRTIRAAADFPEFLRIEIQPDGPIVDRVLGKARLYDTVEARHELERPVASPFFFQDRRHVFFVRPGDDLVTMSAWASYAVASAKLDPAAAGISSVAVGSGGGINNVLSTGGDFMFDGHPVGAAGSAAAAGE
ncbi:MAG TPA: neuraminidase-like domain-containing protein [Longimicrobiaceae bacterium]|nr:neuraminidase-like domain-containing protein [Longimicrobiaceae bacterium]